MILEVFAVSGGRVYVFAMPFPPKPVTGSNTGERVSLWIESAAVRSKTEGLLTRKRRLHPGSNPSIYAGWSTSMH